MPEAVVGRLAPSPTGLLHVGNLSSLLLAWAHARHLGGRIVLRMEDIDGPRVVVGAAEQQMADLRWLGIDWDEGPDVGGPAAPYVQSQRMEHYRNALRDLVGRDLAYACTCSRRDVEEALSAPHARFDPATAYPGTCSTKPRAAGSVPAAEVSYRFRSRGVVSLADAIAGRVTVDLAVNPGDFVIWRRDGLPAYQLAVVVDDLAMGVTDVVRGRDLLDSAARQTAVWTALGAEPPRFWHVPLVVDARGQRLAKRDRSLSLDGLRHAGWSPAALRGALALLWGWVGTPRPLAVEELARLFRVDTLRAEHIVLPDAFVAGPDAFARWVANEGGESNGF